jgi:hypothetical protein
MSLELHRRAEHLMWQADRLAMQGDPEQAAERYRKAAAQEAEAYARTPLDWDRTRGVLAVSSAALYRKAGDLKHALQQAKLYLGHDGLTESARHDLEAIVDEVRAELEAASQAPEPQRHVGLSGTPPR